jgi:hypothetical protein
MVGQVGDDEFVRVGGGRVDRRESRVGMAGVELP